MHSILSNMLLSFLHLESSDYFWKTNILCKTSIWHDWVRGTYIQQWLKRIGVICTTNHQYFFLSFDFMMKECFDKAILVFEVQYEIMFVYNCKFTLILQVLFLFSWHHFSLILRLLPNDILVHKWTEGKKLYKITFQSSKT